MHHADLKARLLAAGWEQQGEEWVGAEGEGCKRCEVIWFFRTFRGREYGIGVFRAKTQKAERDAWMLNDMGWKDLEENLRLPKDVIDVLEICS
jgi:hypothetical protein